MFYDRDGLPVTTDQWAEKFEDMSYRRIGQTKIKVDDEVRYRVSTVWLGLDHAFGDGPPLIFETMVFGADSYVDQDVNRYSTLDQARRGHEDMVTEWAARTVDDGIVSVENA